MSAGRLLELVNVLAEKLHDADGHEEVFWTDCDHDSCLEARKAISEAYRLMEAQ